VPSLYLLFEVGVPLAAIDERRRVIRRTAANE
jgi:hypothetical protein